MDRYSVLMWVRLSRELADSASGLLSQEVPKQVLESPLIEGWGPRHNIIKQKSCDLGL